MMSWFVHASEPTRHQWHGHPTGLIITYTDWSFDCTWLFVHIDLYCNIIITYLLNGKLLFYMTLLYNNCIMMAMMEIIILRFFLWWPDFLVDIYTFISFNYSLYIKLIFSGICFTVYNLSHNLGHVDKNIYYWIRCKIL